MNYINGVGLEHEEIANWFLSRLIINPKFVKLDQNKSNEVITVLKLIEKLEPSMRLITTDDDGSNSLAILYHNGQLLINNIPLDKLSSGFISIVKIFQEIVAGYGGWCDENDLNLVDGIVFIDEIEPHLHISWQTKIVNILKDFFPNTTFYITTHSPLVLAGLKDGEAYELYKEGNTVKTKEIKDIDNYFLSDIVNEFFGVDLNKNRIENVDKKKQEKGKKALLDLLDTLKESK
jgi:AAA15 family ATPase/GTPase